MRKSINNIFMTLVACLFFAGCVEDPGLIKVSDATSEDLGDGSSADSGSFTDGQGGNVLPPEAGGEGAGSEGDANGSGSGDGDGDGSNNGDGDGNGNSGNDTDGDGQPDAPDDRNDPNLPNECRIPMIQHQTVLMPDVVKGANVVFLIDDSGSMGEEIKGVVDQIQPFVDGLLAASDNNYRILFLFDERRSVIDRNFVGNPFKGQIAKEEVSYVREETWSSWADAAFFRAFAQLDFSQDPVIAASVADGFPDRREYVSLADCGRPGDYYRPRTFRRGDNTISPCQQAMNGQNRKIQDHLLGGVSVSIVALSDDDIAVPAPIAHDMFKAVLSPLGNEIPMIYHSIVGTDYGNFDDVNDDLKRDGIDRKGQNHMALSEFTGGKSHEITDYDNYGSILDQIKEDVLLGAQEVALACPFRATLPPVVTFNGMTVDPKNYVLQEEMKKVNFLPDAFIGFENEKEINVVITY